MSNLSISKKKEQPLNETLFNLCKDLLRFIDRKVVKKYISPNAAQLPKEYRNQENLDENDKKKWTYFYKDKDITEEEKMKDVFKDDKFLGYLQNLTNSLIIVVDFLEQNQKTVKKLEEETKNNEEKINNLKKLNSLLNNYFSNNNNNDNKGNTEKNNILEDKNLMNIMNKIHSFSSNNNIIETKISQNVINLNQLNNSNNNNSNNSKNIKNKNNSINNIINLSQQNNNNNIIIKKEKKNDNLNNINLKKEINSSNDEIINNQSLGSPAPIDINLKKKESIQTIQKEPNSKDRNELDDLIDNFKVDISLFTKNIKEEKSNDIKNEEKRYHFYQINEKEEKPKEKIFLNKKIEREKEKNQKSNEKEKKCNNNKEKTTPEKKKVKNRKKKSNNKNLDSENSDKKDDNSIQIPLKEEILKLPLLKPIIENNREVLSFKPEPKEDMKDLNILIKDEKENGNKKEKDDYSNKELLKDNVTTKKEKINLQKNKKEPLSLENELDSKILEEFSKSKNQKTELIEIINMLSSIKIQNIKNYNPRIVGPYLVGSYKTISELPSINYSSPIDIMYTYKDILVDKKIENYTIDNIMEKILKLKVLERSNIYMDENMKKIKVKCKTNSNLIISFNIFLIDIGNEENKEIVNNIILKEEKFNFSNKEEEKKFFNIILFLKFWRRKFKLLFIIPEIIDEIAKFFFDKKQSMALIIYNVFYYLYDKIDSNNKNDINFLKNNATMQNFIQKYYNDENNKKMLRDAILKTNTLVTKNEYEELFKKIEEE